MGEDRGSGAVEDVVAGVSRRDGVHAGRDGCRHRRHRSGCHGSGGEEHGGGGEDVDELHFE